MKGVMRFTKKEKLSPRFIGSFVISGWIGKVAYKLAFPPSFSVVRAGFHVSILRWICFLVVADVMTPKVIFGNSQKCFVLLLPIVTRSHA
ncbi:hypothetical protein MTR67_042879 [Solanum verrucosum]|uniref:Tf2-1-like SH3-like domain-containing protein n=1 Tax=Solanum verrucosum TaxID=315347 RepID=A0AAF0UP77_SOLVR|nr:hypothetical protein MTR67_042879 [Solanum verrucosum]